MIHLGHHFGAVWRRLAKDAVISSWDIIWAAWDAWHFPDQPCIRDAQIFKNGLIWARNRSSSLIISSFLGEFAGWLSGILGGKPSVHGSSPSSKGHHPSGWGRILYNKLSISRLIAWFYIHESKLDPCERRQILFQRRISSKCEVVTDYNKTNTRRRRHREVSRGLSWPTNGRFGSPRVVTEYTKPMQVVGGLRKFCADLPGVCETFRGSLRCCCTTARLCASRNCLQTRGSNWGFFPLFSCSSANWEFLSTTYKLVNRPINLFFWSAFGERGGGRGEEKLHLSMATDCIGSIWKEHREVVNSMWTA
jgi:hypothetical protein